MSDSPDLNGKAARFDRRAFLHATVLGAGAVALAACQAPAPARAPAAAGATAGPADWQAAWDALVEAAQREGQLVLHGPPEPDTRQQLPAAFRDRFGIPVDYVNVRTSELVPKMVAEKEAGLITIDAVLTGFNSYIDVLYPAGLVADFKSLLILPETTDEALWVTDPPLYVDPEQRKLIRLFISATPLLAVNRDYVDPVSIKSAHDLLRPEFRKRIVSDDPLVAGVGSVPPAYFLGLFGEDYLRQLYTEQVVSVRDPRQRSDGLARGQYPLSLSPGSSDVQRLLDEGFPIEVLTLQDAPGYTTGGFGIGSVVEGAPHPKAAQLFANWIASREGLGVYTRTQKENGTRKDLNYAEWVPSFNIPKPGVPYLNTYTWEFKGETQPAAQRKLRDMLGGG
jgi:iron(III) transport system substrate-binding protein